MIRCIAIDDEPIALSILREHCNKISDLQLETFSSPVEGMARVAATRPDVVFLDIEMNSHNGLRLAANLPEGTCLIFTTAYARYAIDGFNFDAVDFLHKPIFFRRFEQAIEKVRRRLAQTAPVETPTSETITLKVEHRNVVVNLDHITHVEAMDNYVKVHRRDQRPVVSQITMREMERLLPADRFVRVHRSFIVALAAIESYSNRRITIHRHPGDIPVGRTFIEAFHRVHDSLNGDCPPSF